MFSLLHFLASHPRNADTLKRALHGDADARRLFSFLGVTPTHLESIDEGAIARRSAARGPSPHTVDVTVNLRSASADMTAPASCADRLAEAEEHIRVLEARLAQATAKPEQTPPEEVIVLGPWRNENGVMRREKLTDPWKGFAFMHAYPATPKGAWSCIRPESAHAADQTYQDIGGIPAADDWARDRYALIDAEPGSLEGSLPRFRRWWTGICAYWQTDSTPSDVQVTVLEKSRQDAPGWEIVRWLDVGETITLAHGPQTGEEGKRYALAAAHALGLTGGGE